MTTDGTLLARLEAHAKERGSRPALHDRMPDGTWVTTNYEQYWAKVRRVGKGLIALGHEPEEAVAIVGNNRPDWVICQHGINAAQGIPAPLYTTLLPDQMAYIVGNAQAKIAICDEKEQLDKCLAIADADDSTLETIITMDDHGIDDERVMTLDALMAKGDELDDADLDARLDAVKTDDVALLIYTSGTTGLPKGAMFTHAGIDHIGMATLTVYPVIDENARYVSYLPLCHAAEQGLTNFCSMRAGAEIFFCRDIKKIKDHLIEVKPTFFFAVPRVWEKFEAALRGKMAEASGFKGWLANWALETELAAFHKQMAGGSGDSFFRGIANKLVISKIKSALGLENLIFAGCGAAPISRSTLEYFASLGIVIHEGFGMTETTAFASVQDYMAPRFGTIGKPLPGVKAKIAEDGEILLSGPNMVKGYYRLDEKTDELYTGEWMHTGDLGAIDEDGSLRITGRKKDLIITAGGKNVAPAEMEGYLQGIPGVGQAVVVGDRQPYLAALIVLDPEALPVLEKASGISGLKDIPTAAKNAEVKKFIEGLVESDCNKKVARYQTIKKITILEDVFSVDGGELTPTLKVKRNVVNEKYADEIAKFYDEGAKGKAQPRA